MKDKKDIWELLLLEKADSILSQYDIEGSLDDNVDIKDPTDTDK